MHWHYTNKMILYLSKRFRTIMKNNHAMSNLEGYIHYYMYLTFYIYTIKYSNISIKNILIIRYMSCI